MIKVNLVLGFLNSGKTTLINNLLEKSEELKDEKIIVIQQEKGKVKLLNSKGEDFFAGLSKEELKRMIVNYDPDRIIVECNSMSNQDTLAKQIDSSYFKKLCTLETICTCIDMKTADLYMRNLAKAWQENIIEADYIFINNCDKVPKSDISEIMDEIKQINECADIIINRDEEDEINKIAKGKISINYEKAIGIKHVVLGFLIFLAIFMFGIALPVLQDKFQKLNIEQYFYYCNNIFMGLLIESIPFVLIGALLSGIIQIFMPANFIENIIPKNKVLSSILAAFLGIIFPICDCGTVPIARGLIKKGIKVNVAVTFMLSAPIVNPIAILATFCAFRDNLKVLFFRILIGMLIAIITGVVVGKFDKENIVKKNYITCNCTICNSDFKESNNIFYKIKGVFIYARDELIDVSKFMIIGILISSIMQTLLSKNIINIDLNNKALTLLIMMGFAFLFSVCSTSDAFIGKGFTSKFPIQSVMGFLILGPMIDIKNLLMLLGTFKKSFVTKIVLLVFSITFMLLMTIWSLGIGV